MNQKLLLAAFGAIALLWAVRNWRKATLAVMVLLVFEGALRKWVFPGAQQIMYFAKDALLIACYFGMWRDPRSRQLHLPFPPHLAALLALAASWAALEIFNPNSPNLLVGILGFKAYFLYVPMMFLVPACFRTDRDLARFLGRYALLAIPVGLLGLAQFASPGSSALNTYARVDEEQSYVATFGSSEHVRVTGTFSFITGYTSFLLAMAILLLALLASSGWRLRHHRSLFLALALTLLGMLMSGSRGPVFLLGLLFPFYWYLAVLREGEAGIGSRAVLAFGVLGAVVAVFGGEAVEAFVGRMTAASDMQGRLLTPFLAPWQLLPDVGLFGFGTGSTHQTAAIVAPSIVPYSWLGGLVTEGETGKILIELGPLGFALIYASRIALLVLAFRYATTLRTRFHRTLATASFLYFLAQIFGSPVFDVVCGVYFWFFAGVLMLAVRLDQQAVRAAAATRAVEPTQASVTIGTQRPALSRDIAWRTPARTS